MFACNSSFKLHEHFICLLLCLTFCSYNLTSTLKVYASIYFTALFSTSFTIRLNNWVLNGYIVLVNKYQFSFHTWKSTYLTALFILFCCTWSMRCDIIFFSLDNRDGRESVVGVNVDLKGFDVSRKLCTALIDFNFNGSYYI